MHNLQEFGPDGELVDVQLQGGEFEQLVQAIEAAQAEMDEETWSVVGPQVTELQDLTHTDVQDIFASKIDALGVSDATSLADFVEEKLRAGPVGNLNIPVHKQEALITRIIGLGQHEDPKTLPSIGDIKKDLPKETQGKVSAIGTKTNAGKIIGSVLAPVELAIHDLAVEVLRGLSSALTAGHDEELVRLKGTLETAQQAIESARDAKGDVRRQMLAKQLEKLGDPENIASSVEGIVFEHPPGSKALYKLTGAFAPLNQIVGGAMRIPKAQTETLLRNYVRMAIMAG
jgi:hypothetical protein